MRHLHAHLLAVTLLLAACAAPPVERGRMVPLVGEPPPRAYEEIARLEVRGDTGAPVQHAYDELRWRAAALDADAVIKTGERTHVDRTPAPYDPAERPLMGNAYPGPLGVFEPGAFPPAGEGLKARGTYYEVEGIAIRYVD
jgi:hypothetical protein